MLVRGKYKSDLTLKKLGYPSKYRKKIKLIKDELKNGDIINCEVTGFNKKNRNLTVRWMIEIDTDINVDNSILNNLDNETLEKLIALKNKTTV